ncbi:MAG: transglycosylase domain-containing protein, partial [Patescibacteria group bacterium]
TIKNATIAIEDRQFYNHPGFSLTAIARAARETYFNKHLQGGSTITQQLVKNSLLTSEISYWRKAREVVLAFWAEQLYTKNEILEMYFNQVPYGGTAWGIEAAAENFFGKRVQDLSLAESAYLAGLPAAPTFYSPYGTHPEMAKVRQIEVLRRMVEDGYITQTQADVAQKETITVKPQLVPIKAPHFVMYVRELLTRRFGSRLVDLGGLRVTTTLDMSLQNQVQDVITKEITQLTGLKVGNGAAIVTNPKEGEILAMIGSRDYFNTQADGNVNVTLAPRQPGSAIKVVTYAQALEKGLTAASIIEDTPVTYPLAGQLPYSPVNYDGKFHGKVTLRNALANSYNIPAVKTLNQLGLMTVIDLGRKMGITTWNDPSRFGLSLTLGGGEVTLFDMATVYGTIANNGDKVDLDPLIKVSDYTGRVYYERAQDSKQVISPETAFIISDILADNRARTQAFGPNSTLVIPGKTVSVKTGTTNDKRDNWTLGFTPYAVVGVWVGNNDNSPMDPILTSGVTGAAPIWNKIMTLITKDKPDEKPRISNNVVSLPCYGRVEYFIRGTEPRGGCKPPASPNP